MTGRLAAAADVEDLASGLGDVLIGRNLNLGQDVSVFVADLHHTRLALTLPDSDDTPQSALNREDDGCHDCAASFFIEIAGEQDHEVDKAADDPVALGQLSGALFESRVAHLASANAVLFQVADDRVPLAAIYAPLKRVDFDPQGRHWASAYAFQRSVKSA